MLAHLFLTTIIVIVVAFIFSLSVENVAFSIAGAASMAWMQFIDEGL